jgi:nucleoside-diphosphate-sugar epimerase
VSTATVAGRARGPIVTEDTACEPATPYQRTKLAVEARIVARATDACPVVVLRPTAVFGSGGRNLRMLASQLARQPRVVSYARACLFGRRPMNLVPVETVVSAIVFAARSAQAVQDRRYLVAADEAPENNFLDVEGILRNAFHIPDYPVPVAALPRAFLLVTQKLTGRHALGVDVTFDTGRLLGAGLVPPLAFPEALRRYARLLATSADVP